MHLLVWLPVCLCACLVACLLGKRIGINLDYIKTNSSNGNPATTVTTPLVHLLDGKQSRVYTYTTVASDVIHGHDFARAGLLGNSRE